MKHLPLHVVKMIQAFQERTEMLAGAFTAKHGAIGVMAFEDSQPHPCVDGTPHSMQCCYLTPGTVEGTIAPCDAERARYLAEAWRRWVPHIEPEDAIILLECRGKPGDIEMKLTIDKKSERQKKTIDAAFRCDNPKDLH